MNISDLQKIAKRGQEFTAFSVKGVRFRCRWTNVARGLFEIFEREGKPTKEPVECDVKGAPDARVELS